MSRKISRESLMSQIKIGRWGKSLAMRLPAEIVLATGVCEGETVEIDTLTELWASANWMERECFDMFGVKFLGHPDLRRILTYPEFEGYPLRKDYPADRIQPLVQYRDVPNIEKLAPFGVDEGMSFGRQTHARSPDDDSRMN